MNTVVFETNVLKDMKVKKLLHIRVIVCLIVTRGRPQLDVANVEINNQPHAMVC